MKPEILLQSFITRHCIFSEIDIFLRILKENGITRKYLSASRVYRQNSLTWCVHKRKEVPFYQVIFHLCNDPIVYYACILSGFLLSTLSYLFQMFETHRKWDKIVVHTFFLFMGFGSVYRAKNNAHRMGFAFVLMASFIYSISMSTMLMNLFTSPIYSSQIQTVREMLDQNFDLIGNEFALRKLIHQNEVNTRNFSKCLCELHFNLFSIIQTYTTDSLRTFRIAIDLNEYLHQLDCNRTGCCHVFRSSSK